MITQIKVELETVEVVKGSCEIHVSGIGGGLAILVYDSEAHVGGAAYVLLGAGASAADHPGRFAQTAIPCLVENMVRLGANAGNLKVALVGAAGMVSVNLEGVSGRTVEIARTLCAANGLTLVDDDLGGNAARGLVFDVGTGTVTTRTSVVATHKVIQLGAA